MKAAHTPRNTRRGSHPYEDDDTVDTLGIFTCAGVVAAGVNTHYSPFCLQTPNEEFRPLAIKLQQTAFSCQRRIF